MSIMDKCSRCEKNGLFRCNGCHRYFCITCLPHHMQDLEIELDHICNGVNEFRATVLSCIKNDSTTKIIEDTCRRSLLDSLKSEVADPSFIEAAMKKASYEISNIRDQIQARITDTTHEINRLTQEVCKYKESGEYNEADLRRSAETLNMLRREIHDPGIYYSVQWNKELECLRFELVGNCAYGVAFVDLSDTNGYKRVEWSQTAPEWRRAVRGICLEGFCENKTCETYGQRVIIGIGMKKFDLLADPSPSTTPCPICKQYVEPTTCGFNNCKWRWQGTKQISGQPPMRLSEDWKHVDNAYHYFDQTIKGTATTSGTCIWRALQIEAKSLSED